MAIGTLAVTSILPLRFLVWANWFSEQSFVILAPVAHPVTAAADLIIPSRRPGTEATERERTLRDEIERARVRLLQSEQRNAELEALVVDLSRGALLHPDVEVSQLPRQVVGEAGEMLVVRTGTGEGVYRGAVVTAQSVQLVGRVADADARTSRVLPINARGGVKILGVVVLDEQTGRRAACVLEPAGDGTMVGEVSPPEDGRAEEITVGQTVRLFDEQWPRHAQMLVIGEVTRVEPSADQPLRRRITVTPRVNLRRPGEVIVRLPIAGGPGGGG
jgi:cell shape-determining protein MreC|tara:strand:+ start:6988 stop:7812 length:825 start_codon:yes stop_codon:yes gene_type:complete